MKAPTAKITRFGSFTCGERIHVSDVSESFIAMATGSDELLVLKRLKSADDQRVNDGFRAVAEAARRFDHPNLCRVSEHGRDYLVRPYAEGKDLRAVMRRLVLQQQQIEEPTALLVAREVCLAMEHVHMTVGAHDRVTGSVGARHVVLTYDGAVRLIDAITPGDGLDPGADVAAIGGLLHEMLTGAPPPPGPAGQPGELDQRVLPLVRAGFTGGLTELRAAIEGRLSSLSGGQVSAKEIAALVGKVFAQARRSDRLWRRQLSAPSEEVPSLRAVQEQEAAAAQPGSSPAQQGSRPAAGGGVFSWVFGALVVLSLGLLAYRGVVALRAPRALLSVRSDRPAEIVIDGEQRHTTPLQRLSLSPGEHRLVFRLANSVVRRNVTLSARQHVDLRLRAGK